MKDNRIPHRVLDCYIRGNRSRGMQRKTWMNNVKEDLWTYNTDIRDVTDLTRDRTIWRNIVQTHRQFISWKRKKRRYKSQLEALVSIHTSSNANKCCLANLDENKSHAYTFHYNTSNIIMTIQNGYHSATLGRINCKILPDDLPVTIFYNPTMFPKNH